MKAIQYSVEPFMQLEELPIIDSVNTEYDSYYLRYTRCTVKLRSLKLRFIKNMPFLGTDFAVSPFFMPKNNSPLPRPGSSAGTRPENYP